MPDMPTYHRPDSLEKALELQAGKGQSAAILAGGTALVPQLTDGVSDVIDLQDLNLGRIEVANDQATVGAMVRLAVIAENQAIPGVIRQAAKYEGPNTLRNAATVGGSVIVSDRESEFCAALLAYEAKITLQDRRGRREVLLEKFLIDDYPGCIVTQITFPQGGVAAHERVARTPADRPIVAVIGRRDTAGQTRLAFCGVAERPVLLKMARLPDLAPPPDFRGSSEYRRVVAIALAERVARALDRQT